MPGDHVDWLSGAEREGLRIGDTVAVLALVCSSPLADMTQSERKMSLYIFAFRFRRIGAVVSGAWVQGAIYEG